MITLGDVAFLKKSIDCRSLESKALDMRQSCAWIDADRTEQEIRALWSMAAEAPEAKADGQDLETEKPA